MTKKKKSSKAIPSIEKETVKSISIGKNTNFERNVDIFGEEDWLLLSQTISSDGAKIIATEAMKVVGVGCLIKTSTQIFESISEALIFIPNVGITDITDSKGKIIGRKLIR